MEAVSRGPAFRQRLTSDIDTLVDEAVAPVTLVTLIDTLDYPTPVTYLRVCGYDAANRLQLTDLGLQDFLIVREGRIFARHRSLAQDPLLARFGHENTKRLMTNVLIHARPYVSYESLQQGSRDALIVRGLLRAKALEHWIGLRRLPDFYESLQDAYGWNSRYWEQRAIGEELLGNWEKAESIATRAATMSPDDHRLNTLGSILINRALKATASDSELFWQLYVRASEQFEESRRYRYNNPVPIQTFLSLAVRVAERVHETRGEVPSLLQHDWRAWRGHARQLDAFRFGPLATQLDGFTQRWLALAVE
jgi:hypothetical protein